MNQHHRITLATELTAGDEAYHWLARLCQCYGLTAGNEFKICLGTIEAINNLLIHSPPQRSAKEFHLHVRFTAGEVEVEIAHRAPPFETPQSPSASDEELALLNESGRGWLVLKAWFDSVEYFVEDGYNRLLLVRRISACTMDRRFAHLE